MPCTSPLKASTIWSSSKDILGRLDSLVTNATERTQAVAWHLRLTAPQNSGKLGIYQRVSTFLNRYPDVQISWLLVNRYVNLIEEGIDLAVRVGELPDSTFIARHYAEFKVPFVASPKYLDQHGTPSSPT